MKEYYLNSLDGIILPIPFGDRSLQPSSAGTADKYFQPREFYELVVI
jgi:hypothetical protein